MQDILRFYGPYPLCSVTEDVLSNCPYAHEGGVYLWVCRTDAGQYQVTYIGITARSFYARIKEHVIFQLGGMYGIYDPQKMRKGELEVLWGGLYGGRRNDKLPEFLRKYEQLAPIAKELLFAQELFLGPLKYEARLLQRIEGALAVEIRKDVKACSLLPAAIRYRGRRDDEEPIAFRLELPYPISGLGCGLVV
jgi:hypothetical protein